MKDQMVDAPTTDTADARATDVPATGARAMSRSAATDSAHRLFSVSMALSGLRCVLSYVIVPVVAPLAGGAAGLTPVLGIPLGVVALFYDVVAVRRFWVARHPWRRWITVIYAVVMCLVLALVVGDIVHLS